MGGILFLAPGATNPCYAPDLATGCFNFFVCCCLFTYNNISLFVLRGAYCTRSYRFDSNNVIFVIKCVINFPESHRDRRLVPEEFAHRIILNKWFILLIGKYDSKARFILILSFRYWILIHWLGRSYWKSLHQHVICEGVVSSTS